MDRLFQNQIKKIKLHNEIFEKLIVDNDDNDGILAFLREKATKSFIIDIYTFWESYTKELIFEILKKNSLLIVSEEFISKYTNDIFSENSKIKEIYSKSALKSFREKKLYITKEIVCSSNNLNYKALFNMLNKIFPDLKDEELLNYLLSGIKLGKCIEKLKEVGVEKEESTSDISGYLQLLVSERNAIAHSHEFDLSFNFEQRLALVCFIEELSIALSNFITSKLINIKIQAGYEYAEIQLSEVYKCNNEKENGLVCLEFDKYKGNAKPYDSNFYLKFEIMKDKKNSLGFFFEPIKINEIRNEASNKCRVFPKKGKRSMSFNSNKKIKQGVPYTIVEVGKENNVNEILKLEIVVESFIEE